MIITANNYELVKLDKPLVKGSGTDTDYDGVEDWDEVNVGLIYQLNPMSMGKKALLMDDMPTFGQCKEALGENLFYVREGLTRFKQSEQVSGMPTSVFEKYFETPLNAIRITPIRSCPIDADSDNDGVIDFYDSKPLNETNRTPKSDNDESVEFGVAETYSEWEAFTLSSASRLYSMPFETSSQFDITVQSNLEVKASALIISRKEPEVYVIKEAAEATEDAEAEEAVTSSRRRIQYWIKVKFDGRFGYLPCEVLRFDIEGYISELNSKTSDVEDGFYGWYYPIPDSVGVYRPVPRFVQSSWGPCAVLSMMMTLYNINNNGMTASDYYDFYYIDKKYRDDFDKGEYYKGGLAMLGNSRNFLNDLYVSGEELFSTLRQYLDQGLAVEIGANKTPLSERGEIQINNNNHYSVIVGYKNGGQEAKDYILIDTLYYIDFPTNLEEFLSRYPYGAHRRKDYRVIIYA